MGETMKAVVIEEFGGPEVLDNIAEVPIPEPAAGELLLRVRRCAVCFLDTIVRSGVRPGIKTPLILGHEIVGDVAGLGPNASGFKEGDRVAATYRWVCGHCWYCRDQRSVFCTNVQAAGVDRDGGYAEYAVLPTSSLAPVPAGVSDEEASISGCVLGAVLRGVREKARVRPGDNVLVTGASGGAGIHSVQLAKLAGGRVFASTTSPDKTQAIREAGADDVLSGEGPEVVKAVKDLTSGRGADVVIDCVGQATAGLSLRSLARGGRLVFVGELGTDPTNVSVARMLYRETEIYGVASPSAGELATLLELIDEGGVRPLISETLPLERASDAHRMLAERSNLGRVVLQP